MSDFFDEDFLLDPDQLAELLGTRLGGVSIDPQKGVGMEQEQLQELEQKLAIIEGGASIFAVIKDLACKVVALEVEVSMLAEAVTKFYHVLEGLAQLDAQQRAQLKAEAEALTTRKPKPEPKPPTGGGKAN